MSRTAALSAPSAGAPLEATTIERRALRDDDIRIDIAFAGICHSDIHQVREEWGSASFPMVPGHEIAGVVSAVGDGVTKYKVGDRVGVGCMVDSCGACAQCKDGHENFCENRTVWTYNDTNLDGEPAMGGYSQQIVVSERFAVRIPDDLELDVAAPLLCAGITVYTPLKRWGAGPGRKVAVVGMGGLGHMAVKIASAMGAEVTVLSQGTSKEADGRRFGATDYRATADGSVFTDLRGRFDLIVSTISASFDVDAYLGLLKPFGAFVTVGLPPEAQAVSLGALISGDKVLAGSNIGGIELTQEMLDFCAEHGIGAEVERISAEQVNEAYDRVVGSDVRYRFVIDTATISPAS
ncbi:NAD(P)-dependent alcohol dehydrogenase [Knoellia sp. 3-2P3]|uniref:NAD(P)-dependent alcohol dehydrogenase n=1 Tax=unclassified Knoellia TaxID=2618719 RepID=UPI0023DA8DBB|nr:NAD(P)-dependent alcohol dehydrogenase [Knoellia sp. 3-2P3]MDF2093432.1 NAD(P)-dependent alcohol dehydrogenase [Knoellia sp. 3-2P3]